MTESPTFPAAVIAKICGLSERQIHRLVKEKTLSGSSSRGQWPITNVTEYIEHLRAIRADGGEDGYAQKTRLLKEQADKIAMSNALARRDQITVGEFHQMMVASFGRVRAKLLALPSKMAPLVMSAKTAAEAQALLRDAVHDALEELSATTAAGVSEDGGFEQGGT